VDADDVVDRLLSRLGLEPDEGAVLSAVYEVQNLNSRPPSNEDDGPGAPSSGVDSFRLRHASLVFGPPEMAAQSWPAWEEAEGLQRPSSGVLNAPANFCYRGHGYVAGRVGLSGEDARAWLLAAVTTETVPPAGALPEASVALLMPEAEVRVFPHLWTPVSRLVRSTVRPVPGFFFARREAAADAGASGDGQAGHDLYWSEEVEGGAGLGGRTGVGFDVLRPPPDTAERARQALQKATAPTEVDDDGFLVDADWEVGGDRFYGGCMTLVGIAVPHASHRMQPPPRGLLVGRVERRAWLTDIRGDGKFTRYRLTVGFDRELVDPARLEVELFEFLESEVVTARRMSLAELVPHLGTEQSPLRLELPMLGAGTSFRVRLWTRDGELLDTSKEMRLLSQLKVTMRLGIDGEDASATHSFSVGGRRTYSLEERLQRFDDMQAEFEAALRAGADSRFIADAAGVTAVTEALAGATGELLIQDPYFGKDGSSWSLLAGVKVPVRVLTGPDGKAPPAAMSNVQVRRWKTSNADRLPTFHDRHFIWSTSGFSLGTSPNGLGNRDTNLSTLQAADIDAIRTRFEANWSSPSFENV
jgi:hypothetical protein